MSDAPKRQEVLIDFDVEVTCEELPSDEIYKLIRESIETMELKRLLQELVEQKLEPLNIRGLSVVVWNT